MYKKFPQILLAVIVLISGLAMAPYSELPEETFSFQRNGNASLCEKTCLRVRSIHMEAVKDGDNVSVLAKVKIVRDNGKLVEGALVQVRLTTSSGKTSIVTGTTNSNGGVQFKLQGGPGKYMVEILKVGTNDGTPFDSSKSVLSQTFILP